MFRANAGQQKVRLISRIETDRDLPGLIVPAVRDALSNLVLNALQAIPEGGTVSITAGEESHEVIILVQDSGPGIAKAVAERIWEPFFTTKQRGTGLGLAIVRKRMEEIGGSAQILEANNGGGARFELRVPLQ